MGVFSTNQVRQLYVATKVLDEVTATSDKGSITVKSDNAKDHLYFQYKGVDTLMRSDLIEIKNILCAKATSADDMARPLKTVTVSLNSDINGGEPAVGQDYILRVAFRQYVGMSDEDQYFKYGMVHAYSGLTASDFYKILAISLAKNFSREITPLVKIEVTDGSTNTEVTPLMKKDDLTGTYTGVVITEVEQPWRLGVMAQVPVYFEVYPTTIMIDGDNVIWGTVEDNTPKKKADGTFDPALSYEGDTKNALHNGKTIADLEYFYMGERGDTYRSVGYPNNIVTEYLVDSTKPYYTFDIHYAYVGSNESVQKSEKDITIVCADKAQLNTLIGNFNTATGLTVASIA